MFLSLKKFKDGDITKKKLYISILDKVTLFRYVFIGHGNNFKMNQSVVLVRFYAFISSNFCVANNIKNKKNTK